MDYLIVVDIQNDFVTGSLGSGAAVEIVPKAAKKIKEFCGSVIFTRDTHDENYLKSLEGEKLPVEHCIKPQAGWQIVPELEPLSDGAKIFDKPCFASVELAEYLKAENNADSITLIGLCTDICVVSNAMLLKAYLPETRIIVDSACCAGASESGHKAALETMKACQIEII